MLQRKNTVLWSLFLTTMPLSVVDAHVRWVDPLPRPSSSIKGYPCGYNSAWGVGPITTLEVGRNEVVFDEFVCHNGDMVRIALSMGNDNEYDEHVLLDRLPHNDQCSQVDESKNMMAVNITIPDVDCVSNECSLQIIQVMSSKFRGSSCQNPGGIPELCGGGGRMYYSCARVRIEGSTPTIPNIFNDFYGAPSPVDYEWPLTADWCRNDEKDHWQLRVTGEQCPLPTTTDQPDPQSFCFSGESTVVTKNKGTIPLKQLQIGDQVMVAANKFEPVYSFGHYDQDSRFAFLVINNEVEISPNHMMAIDGMGFVPASTVQVGDLIFTGSGELVEVKSISTTISKGMFAPFTPSGTLLVGNILVSAYVSLQPDSSTLKLRGDISTGISFQWLAHAFEFPHRLVCYHLGSCPTERYYSSGLSTWVHTPLSVSQWLLRQNMTIQLVLLLPCLIVFALFAVFELCISRLT